MNIIDEKTIFNNELERREYSKSLHEGDHKEYDRLQNALCFVVVGAIALIIGIIFLFLAYKKENGAFVGINFSSFQFIVSIIGLVCGSISLIYGTIRAILAGLARKKYKQLIYNFSKLK